MYLSTLEHSSSWTPLLIAVTFTVGTEFCRACSVHHRAFTSSHPSATTPTPALFKMSKDEKASAAAAQLLIDDEPDDWCVQWRDPPCEWN
jgi:hypothetical protein